MTEHPPAVAGGGARIRWPDVVAVVAILALFPIVHDVPRIIAAPYWLDEAWVALSTRFPLSDLPVVTASTPIGWSFLLRLVPDPDALRVVPVAFHLLTIVAAYALGRSLAWRTPAWSRLAGTVCGLAALLVPAEQVRHDLKQYTADAAVTLGLLVLAARVEARPSRGRLGALAGLAAVGVLVSHAAVFVTPCVFAGLIGVAALRRTRSRLGPVLVAGGVAGVAVAIVYFTVDRRANSDAMRDYWAAYFPSVGELPRYLGDKAPAMMELLGVFWPVALLLGGAGVVTMVRRGRTATAVAIGLLLVVVVLLGVLRTYPLLDVRTSHFLVVTVATVAGIGLVGIADAVTGRLRRGSWRLPAAAAACAVLLGAFVLVNLGWYRNHDNRFDMLNMEIEDTRTATRHVAEHRQPNDVILMNEVGAYGLGFYWSKSPIALATPYPNALNWMVSFPGQPLIIVAGPRDVADALNRALTLAEQSGGRVWLIRTHLKGAPELLWTAALAPYRVELVTGGQEPVAIVSRS